LSTKHDISIGVARGDEPEDAYFWNCVCGKSGPLRSTDRSAIAGGRSHFVAMTKPRRPHDPTRYAKPGTPPPTPEQVAKMAEDFRREVGPDALAYIEKLRVARERRAAAKAAR
jgi:hypothetical protein